jgi:hypothetical protein
MSIPAARSSRGSVIAGRAGVTGWRTCRWAGDGLGDRRHRRCARQDQAGSTSARRQRAQPDMRLARRFDARARAAGRLWRVERSGMNADSAKALRDAIEGVASAIRASGAAKDAYRVFMGVP